MDDVQTVTATPDELQALLALVQRAPMSLAERIFANQVFARWYNEMQPAPPAETNDLDNA